MSYYLEIAETIRKDHPEVARVIEELYEKKAELEQLVTRISYARDSLVTDKPARHGWYEVLESDGTWQRIHGVETGRFSREGKTMRYRTKVIERRNALTANPPVKLDIMEKIRQPGWYEVYLDGNWTRNTFQEARKLNAKGWAVRFRNETSILVEWPFYDRRGENLGEQATYLG
jgi:hypothetical protein